MCPGYCPHQVTVYTRGKIKGSKYIKLYSLSNCYWGTAADMMPRRLLCLGQKKKQGFDDRRDSYVSGRKKTRVLMTAAAQIRNLCNCHRVIYIYTYRYIQALATGSYVWVWGYQNPLIIRDLGSSQIDSLAESWNTRAPNPTS